MFKKIMRAIAKARTSTTLNNLSDHQLRDIGLERGQIAEYVDRMLP